MDGDQGYVPTSDGGQLFYRIIGSGPDTIVIPALHSLVDDMEPLAREHRLIFYDQRGRGGSSLVKDERLVWSDYEVHDLEIVRQYFNLRPCSLTWLLSKRNFCCGIDFGREIRCGPCWFCGLATYRIACCVWPNWYRMLEGRWLRQMGFFLHNAATNTVRKFFKGDRGPARCY